MTFRTITTLVLSLWVLGCGASSAPGPRSGTKGVDTSEMSTRERAALDRLMDEMLAPCADIAVTLNVCVQENRACNACVPAANFLAERVKAGLDKPQIRESYRLRFAGEKKQVELADSPSLGPANAPVTIVMWSDFECPYCKRVVPLVEKLLETHAGKVRLVHKFYPIDRHTNAKIAARAAWAAQQQGKYWELEHLLFENQSMLGEQTILELAASLGLDMDRVKADMESEGAKRTIERDKQDAERLGLMGTPFVLINGREFDLRLFQPEQDLENWVATEIELAGGK